MAGMVRHVLYGRVPRRKKIVTILEAMQQLRLDALELGMFDLAEIYAASVFRLQEEAIREQMDRDQIFEAWCNDFIKRCRSGR